MFKRVKTAEEEEEKIPLLHDGFSIGESHLNSKSTDQLIRKSNRKRIKSKIMREVDGEVSESFKTESKLNLLTKGHQDIQRIKKLDDKAKKNEQLIALKEEYKYLVPYRYNYESVHNDVVCYCQSFSGGDMVACDNKQCKIEWFHCH